MSLGTPLRNCLTSPPSTPPTMMRSEPSLSQMTGKDREAVPGSSRATPSNITIQGAKKDAIGTKKRRKWHPQCVVVTAGYDDNDMKAGRSDKEYVIATECGVKCEAWSLTYYFERLLEEACPNHAYPVKHKHVS
jgi:hypothetical protein